MPRVARAILTLLGLVVCAWFALGIRQAHDTAAVTAIVTGTSQLTAEDAQQASGLLRAASFLNPDSSLDVLRARIDLAQGDFRGARRILNRVVGREPENAAAWYALARAAPGSPKTWNRAFRNFLRLVPPVRAG
jgi:predicted Zn-dependent protease